LQTNVLSDETQNACRMPREHAFDWLAAQSLAYTKCRWATLGIRVHRQKGLPDSQPISEMHFTLTAILTDRQNVFKIVYI
jgi:hypothetical protein